MFFEGNCNMYNGIIISNNKQKNLWKKKWLNKNELKEYVGFSIGKIDSMMKNNEIKYSKVGKNVGLKDMRRIIDKYLSKISIKRLGEEEYNINFDFSIKLSSNEKDIFKNMMLENGNRLFYIKISNI